MHPPPSSELSERLLTLTKIADEYLKSRGFSVQQINGQRESVLNTLDKLPKDITANEVFVGKIPRDLYENELLPFMERAGRVYKMRLMMDFGRTNRGFGFVRYMTPDEAKTAIIKLNDKEIRPGEPPIGILASFDNRRLFFNNLPLLSEEQLLQVLSEKIDGIVSVKLFASDGPSNGESINAYVEFVDHKAATQARRILVPSGPELLGRKITVDWAKKETRTPSPPRDINNNNVYRPNRNQNRPGPKPDPRPNNSFKSRSPIFPTLYKPSRGMDRTPSSNSIASNNKLGSYRRNIQQASASASISVQSDPKNLYAKPMVTPINLPSPIGTVQSTRAPLRPPPVQSGFMNSNIVGTFNQNNILGIKAQQMLLQRPSIGNNNAYPKNLPVFPPNPIIFRRPSSVSPSILDINNNNSTIRDMNAEFVFKPRAINVSNINLSCSTYDKIKQIFQLAGRCKIIEIRQLGPSSLTIVYERPEHASIMMEAITAYPSSFERMALPNQILHAETA